MGRKEDRKEGRETNPVIQVKGLLVRCDPV
jgi:hypothetical protein